MGLLVLAALDLERLLQLQKDVLNHVYSQFSDGLFECASMCECMRFQNRIINMYFLCCQVYRSGGDAIHRNQICGCSSFKMEPLVEDWHCLTFGYLLETGADTEGSFNL